MWNATYSDPDTQVDCACSIPANRTSTVILVSSSGAPGNAATGVYSRPLFLAFTDDCLDLPAGLEFVNDFDTATGGLDE